MENLQTHKIELNSNGKNYVFDIREKDYDDSIAYDAFLGNDYILTLSREGKVLFNNLDKINGQQEKISKELFDQLARKMTEMVDSNLHRS